MIVLVIAFFSLRQLRKNSDDFAFANIFLQMKTFSVSLIKYLNKVAKNNEKPWETFQSSRVHNTIVSRHFSRLGFPFNLTNKTKTATHLSAIRPFKYCCSFSTFLHQPTNQLSTLGDLFTHFNSFIHICTSTTYKYSSGNIHCTAYLSYWRRNAIFS